MANEYFASKSWLTKYAQADDSRGAWQDYVKEVEDRDSRSMVQEPRNMYNQGQLVQNTVDGSRPGYAGDPYKGRWSEKNTKLKKSLKDFITSYKKNNPGKPINTKVLGKKVKELWDLNTKKGQYSSHKLSSLRRYNPDIFSDIKVVKAAHSSMLNPWSSKDGLKKSLKDFITSYKEKNPGKAIDTNTLSDEVAKTWKVENGPKKLSALRKHNPKLFEGIEITYTTAGQGPWNKAWKEDPEFRKFFKEKNPGIKWEDIPTKKRDLKSGAFKSYNIKKEVAENIPKNYIRLEEFAEKMGVKSSYIKALRNTDRYAPLNKKLEEILPSKTFKRGVYYPDPSKKDVSNLKTLVRENKDISLESMKFKKRAGSVEPIKALHEELLRDVDATPRELAEAIYGESNARNLRHIGNDASKYTEVLLGSRKVPGLTPPSVSTTEDILGNILNRGGFFNFGNAERRNSMLMERDKILGTKGLKLATLRKKLVGPGQHLDEAMGLAATYERAPGYTELAQKIDPEINLLKGNTIDRDFSVLFEKVLNKKEGSGTYRGETYKNLKEHINLFNKYSKDFQKQFKVDTPIIEYKPGEALNPSKFIKHFDKISPEARKNINDLAKKGVGLRSTSMPMSSMLSKIAALGGKGCNRKVAFAGGRMNFDVGGSAACISKGLERLKNPTNLSPGENANLRALKKMSTGAKGVKILGNAARVLGKLGVVSEGAIGGLLALNDYAGGSNKEEIISNFTYGLAGKSQEEQLTEQDPQYGLDRKILTNYAGLNSMDQRKDNIGRMSVKPGIEKQLIETIKKEQQPFMSGPRNEEFDMDRFYKQQEKTNQADIDYQKAKDQRALERRVDPFAQEAITEETDFMAAEGGLAGLMKKYYD